MPTPYIGITGFTRRQQIAQLLERFQPNGRRLMTGVLLSDKTWHGILNKYPNRYPLAPLISSIWHQDTYCTLHYHTADSAMPHLRQVAEVCRLSPDMGVQLNVLWPDPAQVEWLRQRGVEVILQLGARSLETVNWCPSLLLERLAEYRPDYALFDLSGGRGLVLEPERLIPLMERVAAGRPEIGLVVAGGLNADTVGPVVSVLAQAGLADRLSVDAESGVRGPADEFDLDKCVDYLNVAQDALRTHCAVRDGRCEPVRDQVAN